LINPQLHITPVAIDRTQHRDLQLKLPVTDWGVASSLNSIFVAVTEFGDASRDLPIVFVNAGQDEAGKPLVAPIAVLGLHPGENLTLKDGQWRGRYMPAVLRTYPFCIGRIDDKQFAICVDTAWAGVGTSGGEALFHADGTASPLLEAAQQQLEVVETEVQRTKLMCQRLAELDVLRDMRFDATFPDGRTHTIDGFLTVDEARMKELPDEVILDLYRSGMLSVIHAHWVSLGNMRRLVDWYVEAHPAPEPVVA
jgi:hypothetical protein